MPTEPIKPTLNSIMEEMIDAGYFITINQCSATSTKFYEIQLCRKSKITGLKTKIRTRTDMRVSKGIMALYLDFLEYYKGGS